MKTLRCSQYVIRLVFAIMAMCFSLSPIALVSVPRTNEMNVTYFFLRVYNKQCPKFRNENFAIQKFHSWRMGSNKKVNRLAN